MPGLHQVPPLGFTVICAVWLPHLLHPRGQHQPRSPADPLPSGDAGPLHPWYVHCSYGKLELLLHTNQCEHDATVGGATHALGSPWPLLQLPECHSQLHFVPMLHILRHVCIHCCICAPCCTTCRVLVWSAGCSVHAVSLAGNQPWGAGRSTLLHLKAERANPTAALPQPADLLPCLVERDRGGSILSLTSAGLELTLQCLQ